MERCQGFVQQGGHVVITSGVSSTTKVQQSFPSSQVAVYDAGTLSLSTIFSDDGVTPKANPFSSDTAGYFFFYAANGLYDLTFSGGSITAPFTLSDVQLFDSSGSGGITSVNSQTGPAVTLATGTSGTDFAISAAANTVTLNLPVASATNTGKLSSADWSTFDAKENALTFSAPLSRTGDVVSLDTPVAISEGGTGEATATAAFDALAPTTTKGDLIVHNGTNNVRFPAGTNGYALIYNTGTSTGLDTAAFPAVPITVANGGTGVTTLTGIPVASGISPFTAVAASAQLQVMRRKANQTSVTYEFAAPPYVVSTDFDFTPQAPGGTLSSGVGASITLTPVPLGVNGSDTNHYVYISNGTGSAEAVLITGGSAVSGASSGTLTFTPANNHSGAWTVSSATNGVQEAISYLPVGNNQVIVPAGTTTLNANVSYMGKSNIVIFLSNGLTLAGAGTLPSPGAGTFIVDQRSGLMAPGVGADLTSAATITPTNQIHRVTGTAAIDTITVPSNFIAGVLYLIPTGAFTWTTGGNVAIVGTAVVGKVLVMVYNNVTSKWYPSYA